MNAEAIFEAVDKELWGVWFLIGAALVFWMQAGFAMCEAGMTRAKNTGNILMKNMMDFCIGTPIYWLIGFGIMFGGSGALIGGFDPLIRGTYDFGTLVSIFLSSYVIYIFTSLLDTPAVYLARLIHDKKEQKKISE